MRSDPAVLPPDASDEPSSLWHAADRVAALADDLPFVPETPYERRWLQLLWRALLLVALAAGAYASSLPGDWPWHDRDRLADDTALRTAHGLATIWATAFRVPTAPMARTAAWLEFHCFGAEPGGYRAVSVALHALACVFLWLILRRLGVSGAWLAAAVVAVHPALVPQVAWPGRQPQLLGLAAAMGAVWAMLSARDARPADNESDWTDPSFHRDEDHPPRWPWIVFGLLIAIALTAWPAAALSAAAVLPACLIWHRVAVRRRDWLLSAIIAIVAAIGHGLLIRAIPSPIAPQPWTRGGLEAVIAVPLTLWNVVSAGGTPFLTDRAAWMPLWPGMALLTVATLGALAWLIGAGSRSVALAASAIGLVAITQIATAPTRATTELLAADALPPKLCVALIVATVAVLLSLFRGRRSAVARAGRFTVGVVLIVGCGARTFNAASAYRSADSLWVDTIARDPDAVVAREYRSAALVEAGRAPDAVAALDAIGPSARDADWWLSRGRIAVAQKEFDAALNCFQTARQIDPTRVDILATLANLLQLCGHFDAAAPIYADLIARCPSDVGLHINAGLVQMQSGHPAAAVDYYLEALRLDPESVAAHIDLSNALLALDRLPEAAAQLQQAVAIDPRNYVAFMNAGTVLYSLHAPDKAERMFRAAVHLQPESAEAMDHLGVALAAQGKTSEAVWSFGQALRLDPNYQLAMAHLSATRLPSPSAPLERGGRN